MATKTTPKSRACKPRAKASQKRGTPGPEGLLTKAETDYLIMLAIEAWNYQTALRNIPADTKFDAWRRNQVDIETGLAGISKINRSHVKNVAAKFLELAGRDDEALEKRLQSGPKTDHGDPTDTYESCETYVALIRDALASHAKFPAENLVGGKGHIHPGWIIAAARQRSGKPSLTMDTMADRLDPKTLHGLLSHLGNHISAREGRAIPERRKARVYPAKPAPGSMHEDDPF